MAHLRGSKCCSRLLEEELQTADFVSLEARYEDLRLSIPSPLVWQMYQMVQRLFLLPHQDLEI
jgi:hypothetical protein